MSLAPVARVTSVSLTPEIATNPVGTQHCVTATVTDQNQQPLNGVRVDFNVTGANPTAGFANTAANGQAQFCYTGQHSGQDTITAAVGDISDTATKNWTGEGANIPPVADPQSVSTPEDTPKTIKLTGSDADGDPLTFIIVTPPAHGELSTLSPATAKAKGKAQKNKKKKGKPAAAAVPSTGANNVTYTPDPNFNGPDSFTFKVNDGKADSTVATVNITVTPVQDALAILSASFVRRIYGTPGIAALIEFLNEDGVASADLTLRSIRARNFPKGCGSDILPSDEVTIAPPIFTEAVSLDSVDETHSEGEIKAVEIGHAALDAAQGCNVTLQLTSFIFHLAGDSSHQFTGTACIDTDTEEITSPCVGTPTTVSTRLRSSSSKASKKLAAPVAR
jgi:hypothetical protein